MVIRFKKENSNVDAINKNYDGISQQFPDKIPIIVKKSRIEYSRYRQSKIFTYEWFRSITIQLYD